MSERISVNQAFDPEERRAQQEFDAFMDSRPYQDDKGNVHHPETGKFVEYDAYHDAQREAQYEATLQETDYKGESLDALAHRVADARAAGDKTQALDAEEAFFDKFNAYSEKYGWEKDDESAADEVRVNKDAPLTRTTLDDRLARYTSIMYGEDEASSVPLVGQAENVSAVETKVETRPLGAAVWKNSDHDAPVVVTGYLPADKDGREYVSVEGSSTGIPLDEIEFTEVAKVDQPIEQAEAAEPAPSGDMSESNEAAFNVDQEVEDAKQRLEDLGEQRQQEWEQKQADDEAERIAKLPVIQPINLPEPEATPKVSADTVIPPIDLPEPNEPKAVEAEPRKKRIGERIHDAFVGARTIHLRAAARLQNRGVANERSFREENGRVVEDGTEEKDRRKVSGRLLAVGAFAAGVAGIYIGAKHGMFTGNSMTGHADKVDLMQPPVGHGGGASAPQEAIKAIAENYTVKPGEGYDQLLVDNGIKPTPELLNKIKNSSDPSIRAWTYIMPNGNPGISHSGNMPGNVVESIKKLR